jgi:Ger(x)C family germination protein
MFLRKDDGGVKIKVISVITICSILLVGCWDRVELNDRAYVISLALDDIGDMLEVTYTIPNLPVITAQSSGEATKFIKITKAKTLAQANRDFGKKSNLRINFDHTKVIIFGADFLKDNHNIRKVLDHFDRNPEYSKSLLLLATKDTGKKLLESVPNGEETTGIYLSQVFVNNSLETISAKTIELGNFISDMHSTDGNGVMPNIVFQDNEVVVDGLAVLRDYELKGWMEDSYITPYSWILGKGKNTVALIDSEGVLIPYEISDLTTEMDFEIVDDILKINISIMSEGDIAEYILEDQDKLFKNKYIKEIETLIANEMEGQIDELLDIIQEDYGIDIIGALNKVKTNNRKVWKVTKSNWQDFFRAATIEVDCRVNIRRVGLSK